MNEEALGFFIVYGFVICLIPYIMYHYAPFTFFITYLGNIDLICNVLVTNFPDYFKHTYNTSPESIYGYLSFNIISLISLSGIFLYGLQMKLIGHSDRVSFRSMILISIITFTLPTLLIPYLTKYTKKASKHVALKYIKGKHLTKDETTNEIKLTDEIINKITIIVSGVIALSFIIIEGVVIDNMIHKYHFSTKGRRVFGHRHDNPLENLFK